MSEQRQDAIRALDKASFQGAFGHHDIATLKLTIYELANAHNVMDLTVVDNDMAELGIEERQDVIVRPERPAPGANQAAVNAYKLDHQAWKDQSTAITEVKKALVGLLDGHAKKVVSDPIQGTLLRTSMDMLNLLLAQYHTMSNEELSDVKAKWEQLRWNQEQNFLTFLSTFNDDTTFLVNHDYGPPRGEQVTTLFKAISHVPTLVAPAKASFYQAFPAVEDQTLAALCEHLKTVYRTQYVRTTAAEHHEMNQATEISIDSNDAIITGIAASARATLRGEHVSADQLEKMQAAVTRAIKQCLTTPTQPSRDQPKNQRRDQRRGQEQYQRPERIEKGECPRHRGKFHPWAECNQNPDNAQKNK